MKTFWLAGLALSLGTGLLCVASGQGPATAQADKSVVQQWEYETISGENVGRFNALGAEGWELCATASATPTQSASFIFKRPKLAKAQAAVAPPGSKVWGTWERTVPGAPDHRQVKVINRTHFIWVLYNRRDGTPIVSGGGTYTVDDKHYKEKLEFGGPGLPAENLGKEQILTARFEDDKWELSGTLTNGFKLDEVWRKVK